MPSRPPKKQDQRLLSEGNEDGPVRQGEGGSQENLDHEGGRGGGFGRLRPAMGARLADKTFAHLAIHRLADDGLGFSLMANLAFHGGQLSFLYCPTL